MISLWPPTEVAEGYQYETVRENYTISDGARSMHISYVQPLAHMEGMLVAYLPMEKIMIEADLYDPPAAGAVAPGASTAANRSFYNYVQRLGVEVATIAPVHGRAVAWSEFARMFRRD